MDRGVNRSYRLLVSRGLGGECLDCPLLQLEVVDAVQRDLVGPTLEEGQERSGILLPLLAGSEDGLPDGVSRLGVHQDGVLVFGDLVAVARAGEHELVGRLAPLAPPVQHLLNGLRRVDTVHPSRHLVERRLLDRARLGVDDQELLRNGALEVQRQFVERRGEVRAPVVVDLECEIGDDLAGVAVLPHVAFDLAVVRAFRRVLDLQLLVRVLPVIEGGLERGHGVRVLGVDYDVAGHDTLDLVVVLPAVG